MGSLFESKEIPAPPTPPVSYMRDEINGVEQVPVTNADGSVTYVTRALPLSPTEQAEKDELNRIMQESLGEITRLSSTDYTPSAATQKSLNAWESIRQDALEDTFEDRTTMEEKRLARRGLADSSAGQDVRRQRRLDEQDAQVNLAREKDVLADTLRTQEIGRQQNLYTIASTQNNADLARQTQSAAAGQRLFAQNQAFRQSSLLDYYNTQLARSQQTPLGQDLLMTFMHSLGNSAGSSLGSGT